MGLYNVQKISQKKKDSIMESVCSSELFERKASVHGTCVKLLTDCREFKDMWEDNFEPMPDWIRPHARLFAVSGSRFRVLYEPLSKTVIVEGCDYYGWVKSIALALVADFFEDFTSEHRRYSIHGSFVGRSGRGAAIIGPSGSGKTTLTYGILQDPSYNFITDDWFFVRFMNRETLVYPSERNSYVRGDLAACWPCYRQRLKGIKKDSSNRAVVDVKRLLGGERMAERSSLFLTVLLTRDKKLPAFQSLTAREALSFMARNDFCNPHQLVRNSSKRGKRKSFFREIFDRHPVYLLNTIESPQQSLDRLRDLFEEEL